MRHRPPDKICDRNPTGNWRPSDAAHLDGAPALTSRRATTGRCANKPPVAHRSTCKPGRRSLIESEGSRARKLLHQLHTRTALLPQGAQFDPDRHDAQSKPQTPAVDLDAETLTRRFGSDGTPFCACCDTALAVSRGRGRPSAVCTRCAELRRRTSQARYDATRRAPHSEAARQSPRSTNTAPHDESSAPQPQRTDGRPTVPMPRASMVELINVIDQLVDAVGRGSAHFTTQEAGTWQHQLLLSAKELVRWRDAHLVDSQGQPLTGRRPSPRKAN